MVKIFFVCRRREGLAIEDYRRMVLEEHVPLALEHHRSMRRYEINLVTEVPAAAPEAVSIPALCFDTLADYRERLYDSEEGRAAVEADAARFMGGADAYLTEELVLAEGGARGPLGTRTGGEKTLVLLRHRADAPGALLAERLAALAAPGTRLVLNPVRQRLSEGGEHWDAFVELHGRLPAEKAGAALAELASHVVCYPVDEYVEK